MLKKLLAALTSRSPTFHTWEDGIAQLRLLSIKKDTLRVEKILSRMWDINLKQNHYKPGWVMAVDDSGSIDSLSCFRPGQGTSDEITVKGTGWVLLIRVHESDLLKYGPCRASESHFVQYLRHLCRTQLR